MKKNKIVLFLFAAMFVLSGCTAKSIVDVDAYGKVSETVTVEGIADDISYDDEIVDKAIESSLSKYKAVLDFRGYSREKILDDKFAGAKLNKSYKNICSYFQDTAFNQYVFKHISCTETDDYYEIQNDTSYIPYCSDCSDWPSLDDVSLTINLPVAALENNADEVKNNSYIWRFDQYTNVNKSFYLKIDKSELTKREKKENLKNNILSGSRIVGIIIFLFVLLIAVISFTIKMYKKYKENKIEY